MSTETSKPDTRLIGPCRCGRPGIVAVGLDPARPAAFCAQHLAGAVTAIQVLYMRRGVAPGV